MKMIVECLILEGDDIIGDYYLHQSFSCIARRVVAKLDASDQKRLLNDGEYKFFFERRNHLVVVCVAMDMRQTVCWKCVDSVFDKYPAHNMSKMIKEVMEKHNDPQNDKIALINEKIDDVKKQMIQNIDAVLERGEKLEDLVEKTEDLRVNAQIFATGTKLLRNKYRFHFLALGCLLCCILVFILIVIIFIACDFPSFSRCIAKK